MGYPLPALYERFVNRGMSPFGLYPGIERHSRIGA